MAFRDSWHRALVYFGLAEERDPYDEEEPAYEPEAELEDRYRERLNVRRLGSTRRRRRGGRVSRVARAARRPRRALPHAGPARGGRVRGYLLRDRLELGRLV